ncbi:Chalcone synthase J, partial [Mucuna pruriens]
MIKKRYMHLTEEILKENPNIGKHMAPSLDARQDLVVMEVPKLGKEAARKAIEEWGQPKSKITHLVLVSIVPNSDGALSLHLREAGLIFHLHKDVPALISNNIENTLVEAFQPLNISDYNSIFWIVHPGTWTSNSGPSGV